MYISTKLRLLVNYALDYVPVEGIDDGCIAGGVEKYGTFCWFQSEST